MSPSAGRRPADPDHSSEFARLARRQRRWARPVRPVVPVLSSATVLLAWGLVAHNSGAGWVQAVGDALAGTLVIGLLGPALVAQRARLRVTEVPADARVGLPAELVVVASTRLRLDAVEPRGPQVFVGPRRAPETVDGRVVIIPTHRGAYRSIRVELATAAPFGLLWWTRRVTLALPRELCVAPRLGEPEELPSERHGAAGEAAPRRAAHVGEPRGVRPYRPGDHRRAVHWPATAHTGDLMVRETEGPSAASTTVEVHLPADEDAAERVAERAFGTVVALLDRGTAVVLATSEASGPRRATVVDRRSAGRRLARAVSDTQGRAGVDVYLSRPETLAGWR